MPFGASSDELRHVSSHLQGTVLQRGANAATIKTRTTALLFRAVLRFEAAGEEVASLNLSLDLNLTRFLARNYSRLGQPGDLRMLSQPQRLSWLTIDEEHPAHVGLDGNDNLVSDAQTRSGREIVQADWLAPYVELVLSFLAAELEHARGTIAGGDRPTALGGPPLSLVIPFRNWRIRQLEIFWEFWSPNAVAEASDLVEVAEGISYEFDTTRYDLGRFARGFTFGVSARSQVQGVRHKLYAKLLNRMRYELSYDRVTTQVERSLQLPVQPDHNDFVWYAAGLTQLAATRAQHWLDCVGDAELGGQPDLSRSQITAFFDAIYRSASPATAGLIVGFLLARGAVPRSRVDGELLEAVRSLKQRGFLVASNPGRARHTTTYRAAAPWDALIDALRHLSEARSAPDEISRFDA